MEEVLLGILIDPQRDHVQRACLCNSLDPGDGRRHGWLAVMMTQERVRLLPADAIHHILRIVRLGHLPGGLSTQIGHHGIRRLRSIENGFKEAHRLGAGCYRWGPSKGKPYTGLPKFIRRFGELTQQTLAGLRRQPVRHANQVCFLPSGRFDQLLHWNSRPEEYRPPSGLFRQAQELDHPGHVHAFPDGTGNDSFQSSLPLFRVYLVDEPIIRRGRSSPLSRRF